MGSYGAALRKWDLFSNVGSTSWVPSDASRYQRTLATTAGDLPHGVPILVRGGNTPKWLAAAQDAVNVLLALPAGWNSYAARQIDIGVVQETMELLSAVMNDRLPTIVPVPSGGILLEWQTMDADLEVVVLPSGRVQLHYEKAGEPAIEREYLTQEAYGPVRDILQSI